MELDQIKRKKIRDQNGRTFPGNIRLIARSMGWVFIHPIFHSLQHWRKPMHKHQLQILLSINWAVKTPSYSIFPIQKHQLLNPNYQFIGQKKTLPCFHFDNNVHIVNPHPLSSSLKQQFCFIKFSEKLPKDH